MIGSGVTGEAVGRKGSADVSSLWGLRMGMNTGASSTSSWAILGRLGMNFLGFSSSRKGKLSCCSTIFVVAGKFGNGEGPGASCGGRVGVCCRGFPDATTSLDSFRTLATFCRLPMMALCSGDFLRLRSLFLAAAEGLILCLGGKCGGFSRLRDVDRGLVVVIGLDVVVVVVVVVVVETMSKNGLLKGGGLGL